MRENQSQNLWEGRGEHSFFRWVGRCHAENKRGVETVEYHLQHNQSGVLSDQIYKWAKKMN